MVFDIIYKQNLNKMEICNIKEIKKKIFKYDKYRVSKQKKYINISKGCE